MFDAARRAASRGVRVRLLLDDNSTPGADPLLAMLDADPNIEVRLFNPFAQRSLRMAGYLTDFARLNRRMHNKSFTVDNQATVVGGRNIGDEYFDTGQAATFADLDVVAIGEVVRDVSAVFDSYWNSESAYPVTELLAAVEPLAPAEFDAEVARIIAAPASAAYLDELASTPLVRSMLQRQLDWEWCRTHLTFDDPDKVLHPVERRDLQMLPRLQAAMGTPLWELVLVSPYFVPGEAGTAALTALVQRGVEVRVLTNSLAATDVTVVHSGYAKRRKALLQGGVRLFELKDSAGAAAPAGRHGGIAGSSRGSLHAKTFGLDRERLFIGSFNLDPRSRELNTEMGLVIESPLLAGQLASAVAGASPAFAYEVTLTDGGQLQWLDHPHPPLASEPGAGALRRALVKVLSWLPIEWLL
jgi:cardiolipin synthase C